MSIVNTTLWVLTSIIIVTLAHIYDLGNHPAVVAAGLVAFAASVFNIVNLLGELP